MNPVSFLQHSFFDERERWSLWLPIAVVIGIALYFYLPFEPPFALVATAPLLAVLAFLSRQRGRLLPFLALTLAFACGFNAAQIETRLIARPALDHQIGPVSMTGTLMRAEPLAEGSRLTLKRPSIKDLPKEDRPHFIRVKVRTPFDALPEAGSRVNLWGPLWPPNDAAVPDGYDFRRHAFFKQLGATGISYVEPRLQESKYPIRFFWDGVRLLFEKARRSLILSAFQRLDPPQEAMTAALLAGTQSGIDKDVMQAMRLSGLSHLLSISGVHVSMMALLIYMPLRFLLALFPWVALRLPIKKMAAGLAIVMTSLYTVLVGADAPTVRSALMTGIVFFAIIMDRKAMSLRLVALAAGFIMLATPSATMGASFQMSFAAVLAMVAAYEKRLDDALKEGVTLNLPSWAKRSLHHVRDIVMTSLIATAATTPFTIFHFQTFSFYGVLANMIAIPLTTLWIMPCLLLTYITAPFGDAGLFIDGAGWGVGVLIHIAQTVAAWPYAQIAFPPMPVWAFALVISGGLWLCLWRTKWRFLGLIPLFIACFYPLFVTKPAVFIADDAPVWAVTLSDGRLAVFGKREENFTIAQWRQRIGNPEALYFSAKNLPKLDQDLFCDEEMCLYENGTQSVAFVLPQKKAKETNSDSDPMPSGTHNPEIASPPKGARNDGTAPSLCPKTNVIVTFESLTSGCKTSATLIDAARLDQHGAHTITFEDGKTRIDTVREKRGLRPWSVK